MPPPRKSALGAGFGLFDFLRGGKKIGFTLAEVLITLTIIGVIAALTIPNLMQKWSDHADVAKVKEAYSILSNAMRMAVAENGTIDSWGLPGISESDSYSSENSLYIAEIMKKYLKVANFCGTTNGKGSCSKYYAYNSDGTGNGLFPRGTSGAGTSGNIGRIDYMARIQLANGMLIGYCVPGHFRSNRIIYVDINGAKKPNRAGYDWFMFTFNENGKVSPGYYTNNKGNYCNGVAPVGRDGTSCAEYVIKHGNMDYKKLDAAAVTEKW